MKINRLMTLTLLIGASLLLSACQIPFVNITRGSGDLVAETREVSEFENIQLNGLGRLLVTQGETETLEIQAEDNIIDELISDVQAGTLVLGYQKQNWLNSVIPTKGITYTLTVKDLDEVTINGAGEIDIQNFQTETLALTINGAGKISINDLTAINLIVQISGTATMELGGEIVDQSVVIDGAGNYQAGDLKTNKTTIEFTGLGNAIVWATETLDITISGGGKLNYYGSPSVTQEISGAGTITSLGEK